jgi:hypothetical protein
MGDPKKYTKTFVAEDWQLTVLLYNFDVGSAALKPEHVQYLEANARPFLKRGFTSTIIGLASRTGPDGYNMTLSKSRAAKVADALQKLDFSRLLEDIQIGAGEDAAALFGAPDKVEADQWRGVLLSIFDPDRAPKPKTKGREYDRLYIYDNTVASVRDMINANDNVHTYLFPVNGGPFKLSEALAELVRTGNTYKAAIFLSHGKSGKVAFDGDELGVQQLKWYFENKGIEKLFPRYTRMYFAGCNVAEGDEGWAFLEAAGRTLLKVGGGLVFGWTSLGVAVPSWFRPGTGNIVHLWGDVRNVTIKPGGEVEARESD